MAVEPSGLLDPSHDPQFEEIAARHSAAKLALKTLEKEEPRAVQKLRAEFATKRKELEAEERSLKLAILPRMGDHFRVVTANGYTVTRGVASRAEFPKGLKPAVRSLRRRRRARRLLKREIVYKPMKKQITTFPHLVKGLRTVKIVTDTWVSCTPPKRKKK